MTLTFIMDLGYYDFTLMYFRIIIEMVEKQVKEYN